MNPLKALHDCGQSVWLDFLARRFIRDGSLQRLVDRDSLSGVTSNPTIFRKAIMSGSDYDASLNAALSRAGCDAMQLYEHVAIEDIRSAADVLLPVYRNSGGADGFVSLEVSPYIASDTQRTISEARRLWSEVARPNIMIKVPGTEPGIPAIRQLLGEGININITLLFARTMYRQVAQAYIDALGQLAEAGADLRRIASVASFFVSRIDTAVDKLIDEKLKINPGDSGLAALKGRIAIANARLAYQDYKQLFSGPVWDRLKQRGARVQRLLWASTSTKNPAYPDVMYVDELIGPDTINTLPQETLEAFRDHGRVAQTLDSSIPAATQMVQTLDRKGIDLQQVTQKLTDEGVQLFADSFDDLLSGMEQRRAQALGTALNRYAEKLGTDAEKAVQALRSEWRKNGNIRRVWRGDAKIWTGSDEANWLGWLHAVEDSTKQLDEIRAVAADIRKQGITSAVLLGMGGSSLGAEVLAKSFGPQANWPVLHVLDSTDPAAISDIERGIDLSKSLFIVSSKSGTTLEPNILMEYFWDRVERTGGRNAGSRFIAITDPDSKLARTAGERSFRHIFRGNPAIGGRYSVLSVFGIVPTAIAGIDVERLLDSAGKMVRSCGPYVPPDQNPGVLLGSALGALARQGRDKVTIFCSGKVESFGAWLEQLLAESTGKHGKGIIPVDAEPPGAPGVYGRDRQFVSLGLDDETDSARQRALTALEESGHPVVRIVMRDVHDIGQEFFRWEMATAIAGSIIGVNPFDQPDVEASKVKTRALMQHPETARHPDAQLFQKDGISVFASGETARILSGIGRNSLAGFLGGLLSTAKADDYCALLAYLDPAHDVMDALRRMRVDIRDRKKIATCVGIGPRFLHSTGQAYKGGPNTGIFIQITGEHDQDLAVPGHSYSFGVVLDATACGDFDVLNERGRRALHVHIAGDPGTGLKKLQQAVSEALG